jgi:hypothetical protein
VSEDIYVVFESADGFHLLLEGRPFNLHDLNLELVGVGLDTARRHAAGYGELLVEVVGFEEEEEGLVEDDDGDGEDQQD